jgi:osomolarity two-component system phosphorelay intermediate protein YPD1
MSQREENRQHLQSRLAISHSSLHSAHLLKSSSAALGLTKLIRDSCRKIQHYGLKKDETGTIAEPDEAKCMHRIKDALVAVKEEYAEAEKVLKKFFSS